MSSSGWRCFLLLSAAALWLGSAKAEDFVARYAKAETHGLPKDAMPFYTARLIAGQRVEETLEAADRMLDATLKAKLDPFHLHAIVHAEKVAHAQLPESIRTKFRAYVARWDFTKPIGVSLNYELMRDGAGWIAAGIWPDLVDAAGNPAAKIRILCEARLRKTLADLAAKGDTEYDAPLYYGTDFMALRLLVDYADNDSLRDLAQKALESMLTDTGAHWHRGYAFSSAGRAKYWGSQQVCPDAPGATTAMAYMLFGGDRDAHLEGIGLGFWLAYPSPWLESLRGLRRWQASLPIPRTVRASILLPNKGMFIRKQAWITDGYGVASQRTDGTSPKSYLFKESRNLVLRWVSDKPVSTFIVFQENRRRPGEHIPNAFAYGENPYSQTLQCDGTVLGLYDVPPDYGFKRITAPFTTRGAILARLERDGWICAHGGSVLFAFRSLTPSKWLPPDKREGLELYSSDAARGGWILETAPPSAFAGGDPAEELDRFAAALATRTKIEGGPPLATEAAPPSLSFVNLAGHRLQMRWKPPGQPYVNECQIDGVPVDYNSFPRLGVYGPDGNASPLPTKSRNGTVAHALPCVGRISYDSATQETASPTNLMGSPPLAPEAAHLNSRDRASFEHLRINHLNLL